MNRSPKMTEVAAHMSFDTIRYSQVWEDSRILNAGLQIDKKDRVLSISSAGCNALSLLLKEPEQVTAVDLNPAQNAILALKLAAFENLSHQELCELLGYIPSKRSSEIFQKIPSVALEPYLDFWRQNQNLLTDSLIKSGRLDTFFRGFAQDHILKLKNIEKLKDCFLKPSFPAQLEFLPLFKEEAFKRAFVESFGRVMLEKGRDPAQFRYVTANDVGYELYQRFLHSFESADVYGNHYFYFFLFHEAIHHHLGPDYIRAENFEKIQRLTDRLSIHSETIENALTRVGDNSFTKANLSNIFEYMSVENQTELLSVMHSKMPKRSRIAYWNLFVDRPLPKALNKAFRVVDMSACQDRVWFYKAFFVLERL